MFVISYSQCPLAAATCGLCNTLNALGGSLPGSRRLFVVFVIYIDIPDRRLVVACSQYGFNRKLCGQHRVVLIIVAMHAVAPYHKEIGNSVKVLPQLVEVRIRSIVAWVCLWHADDYTVYI